VAVSKLENEFNNAMFRIYLRVKTDANYTATTFLTMLRERGGVATAKHLINTAKPSDVYTRLFEKGHLHLTVEAQVVENEKFQPLFEEEEIERARQRLENFGYIVKSD